MFALVSQPPPPSPLAFMPFLLLLQYPTILQGPCCFMSVISRSPNSVILRHELSLPACYCLCREACPSFSPVWTSSFFLSAPRLLSSLMQWSHGGLPKVPAIPEQSRRVRYYLVRASLTDEHTRSLGGEKAGLCEPTALEATPLCALILLPPSLFGSVTVSQA